MNIAEAQITRDSHIARLRIAQARRRRLAGQHGAAVVLQESARMYLRNALQHRAALTIMRRTGARFVIV